jgi:hypothetical protein
MMGISPTISITYSCIGLSPHAPHRAIFPAA